MVETWRTDTRGAWHATLVPVESIDCSELTAVLAMDGVWVPIAFVQYRLRRTWPYPLRMKIAALFLATACLVFLGWLATYLYEGLSALPPQYATCSDRDGRHHSDDPTQLTNFHKCVDAEAKRFLDRDYSDAKDLVKAFLTLLSATLVASITFSEKIVDVGKATLLPLSMMITCWVLLLAAIIASGGGLLVLAGAAGIASAAPDHLFWPAADRGLVLIVLAGMAFVLALFAMVVAGIASLLQKRSMSAAKPQFPAWTWT